MSMSQYVAHFVHFRDILLCIAELHQAKTIILLFLALLDIMEQIFNSFPGNDSNHFDNF